MLLIKITYLEKTIDDERPIFRSSPETVEESDEQHSLLIGYINKTRRRKMKIKAYFTLLVFDLVHILNLDKNLEKMAKKILVPLPQERFLHGRKSDVKNFKDLISFFRDAIAHPEEKNGQISPRRSVKYNFDVSDLFMSGAYHRSLKDIVYKIGDCNINFQALNYHRLKAMGSV